MKRAPIHYFKDEESTNPLDDRASPDDREHRKREKKSVKTASMK